MANPADSINCTYFASLWLFATRAEVGWFLPYWGVTISDPQLSANKDGIDPAQHPALMEYLSKRGVVLRLNRYGLIDIPRTGMRSLDELAA
jgi:hypothetical protein